jgi:hypothetical protein
MERRACLLIVAFVLAVTAPLLAATTPNARLLSTTAVARKLQAEIQAAQSTRTAKNHLATMQREIDTFLTRQIEAYPSISSCDLESQLASALNREEKGCREREPGSDYAAPRVLTQDWGPKTTRRTFAVVYLLDIFVGIDGSETVLETYTWDQQQGVHRTAAFVPRNLRGVVTTAYKVCWFPNPDRYWILVAGDNEGASGRAQSGTASVFEIAPNSISTVWQAPSGIGNVIPYAMPLTTRWEIEYADVADTYADRPKPSRIDIFQVDYLKHTYHRLAHIPINPQ